ncbi:MAG TPA: MATE family efflux transporter [Clostridia bacterium]|nr:MATE family efflux transporter [Clostridia bacterium]
MVSNIEVNLTEGSVTKKLAVFAAPFFAANFLQAMYGAIDTAIVGWFSNAGGIAAISIGSQVMQIMISLVTGITLGGTILIAQYLGAMQKQDLKELLGTMLTIFFILAVVLTALMGAFTIPILNCLNTPPEAYAQAKAFVYISSAGTVFIVGYNAISAIMRGFGNSKQPLIFIAIACVTNILLDFLFVGFFRLGPAGAAISTVTAQAASMVLSILYLKKNDFIFDFKLKSFRIQKDKAAALLKLGIPVCAQETMINFSFLFITAIVNSFGVVASAAVGISDKFITFAMLPASALSGAIASMTAQNMGAGYHDRARKTMRVGILFSVAFALVFFLWVQIIPETVLHLFRADAAVIADGVVYLRAFSYDFIMVSFVFCMDGFVNGCGHTTFSLINGLVSSFFVRVPLAFLLSKVLRDGLFGVGVAAPAASVISIIIALIYIRSGHWQKSKIIAKK